MKVYKHVIENPTPGERFRVGEVYSFGVDPQGQLCIWFEGSENPLFDEWHAVLVFTGQDIPLKEDEVCMFKGSVQWRGLMWHLFLLFE